jgi:hypothetical protein
MSVEIDEGDIAINKKLRVIGILLLWGTYEDMLAMGDLYKNRVLWNAGSAAYKWKRMAARAYSK